MAAVAAMWVFVLVPFAALTAAVPFAWGWGLSWTDLATTATAYVICGFGVTVGFHRYLTHGAFKARRWLRVTLAVAGTLAVQGSVIQWVADHRRHHAFADRDGDPHSPWRYGESVRGLAKGLVFAHVGWLLQRDLTNRQRFAKDLLADADIRRVDRLFLPLVAVSLLAPPVAGGLMTGTWGGALTAFFWATVVRRSCRPVPPRTAPSVAPCAGSRVWAARPVTATCICAGPCTSGASCARLDWGLRGKGAVALGDGVAAPDTETVQKAD